MIPSSYQEIWAFIEQALRDRNREGTDPRHRPSDAWLEVAKHFEYVRELSDKELQKIRIHTYHLTFDNYLAYLVPDEQKVARFDAAFARLSDALGGFRADEGDTGIGIELDGHRVSWDLIRYLQVLVDLVESGALQAGKPCRVMEIGGGYGGLAAALTSYNPQASYLIVDLEETMFFQAVHLANRFGFESLTLAEGPSLDDGALQPGRFVLVPQSRAQLVDGLSFDLAINQQSMQEMREDQVRYYCDLVLRNSSRFYSCNRPVHEGAVAAGMGTVENLTSILDGAFPEILWQPSEDEPPAFGDWNLPRRLYMCRHEG